MWDQAQRNYTTGGTIARHSAMARIHHASIQAPSIENIVEMRVESVGLCRRPKVAVISEGTVAERLAGYQRVLNYCNSARGINLTQSSSTPLRESVSLSFGAPIIELRTLHTYVRVSPYRFWLESERTGRIIAALLRSRATSRGKLSRGERIARGYIRNLVCVCWPK